MAVKNSFNTITVEVDANCISAENVKLLASQRAIYGLCIPVALTGDNKYGYAASSNLPLPLAGFLMEIEGKSGAETKYMGTLLTAGKVVDIPASTVVSVGTNTLVVTSEGEVTSDSTGTGGKWVVQKASSIGDLFVDIVG